MINPLANVKSDQIGRNVWINEFAVIEKGAVIHDNVIIHPFAVIGNGVIIGDYTEVFHGAIIGKTPKGVGATARPIYFEKIITIGNNCSIGPHSIIYYDVEIQNNILIGDGASIREQVRIGNHSLIGRYVTINYNSSIGNNTRIMDFTHITGNSKIGNNVFISIHVSTVNDNLTTSRTYTEEQIIGPFIEDDVSIGAGAILLPKINIGKGAFIAAGAIVTKDVAPNKLVMGIPARVIKSV